MRIRCKRCAEAEARGDVDALLAETLRHLRASCWWLALAFALALATMAAALL